MCLCLLYHSSPSLVGHLSGLIPFLCLQEIEETSTAFYSHICMHIRICGSRCFLGCFASVLAFVHVLADVLVYL